MKYAYSACCTRLPRLRLCLVRQVVAQESSILHCISAMLDSILSVALLRTADQPSASSGLRKVLLKCYDGTAILE